MTALATDFFTTSLSSEVFIDINNTIVLEKSNTNVVRFINAFRLDCLSMKYGDRLRLAREHKGISQDELARLSGVKQGTISKIERGDQNSSGFDAILAHTLNIDAMWLYTGDSQYAPEWLVPENIKKNITPLYQAIERLSPEQQAEVENFVRFTAEKTQKTENKPLTAEPQNAGGGGLIDRNGDRRELERRVEAEIQKKAQLNYGDLLNSFYVRRLRQGDENDHSLQQSE